jgi:uncharacterized protein DUF4446
VAALIIALVSLVLSLMVLVRVRRRVAPPVIRSPISDADRDYAESIATLGSQLEALVRRMDAAELHGQRAIQRIGIVRYNPFEDTGSNQSFVVAFLDARGDGFVLSSLHSRQQTRVFLKPLAGGRAETAMSEEEAEAIRRAGGS